MKARVINGPGVIVGDGWGMFLGHDGKRPPARIMGSETDIYLDNNMANIPPPADGGVTGEPPPSGSTGAGSSALGAALQVAVQYVLSHAGDIVSWFGGLFSGHSAGWHRWQNAGPGVHDWFTKYGPQDFLDWMDKNFPNDFTSVQRVKDLLVLWLADSPWGWKPTFLAPNGFGIGYTGVDVGAQWYTPNTPEQYRLLGIDYAATNAAIQSAKDNDLAKYAVPIPGGAVDVAAQQSSEDAVDAANNGTANGSQMDLLNALLAAGAAWLDASGIYHFGTPPSTGGTGTGGGTAEVPIDIGVGTRTGTGTNKTKAPVNTDTGGGLTPPETTESTATMLPLLLLLGAGALIFTKNS